MSIKSISYSQFNEMVVSFHNQMLFLRLINILIPPKCSNLNKVSSFTIGFKKSIYHEKIDIFNKIYSETYELVKGPYVTPEIEKMQNDFYINTQNWVRGIAEYMANNGKIR